MTCGTCAGAHWLALLSQGVAAATGPMAVPLQLSHGHGSRRSAPEELPTAKQMPQLGLKAFTAFSQWHFLPLTPPDLTPFSECASYFLRVSTENPFLEPKPSDDQFSRS